LREHEILFRSVVAVTGRRSEIDLLPAGSNSRGSWDPMVEIQNEVVGALLAII
jgi:hypothetical protein